MQNVAVTLDFEAYYERKNTFTASDTQFCSGAMLSSRCTGPQAQSRGMQNRAVIAEEAAAKAAEAAAEAQAQVTESVVALAVTLQVSR